jgi:hypothetical protein
MKRDSLLPLAVLAVAALVAIGVAVTFGLAANGGSRPNLTRGSAPPDREDSRDRSDGQDRPAEETAISKAVAYALAARNWAPATYADAWSRQLELAGGGYRRVLAAQRPKKSELEVLREDRARSEARVVRAERDELVRPPAARVLVVLDEATAAAGQTIRGLTVNEVRLRRRERGWLVVGWTVLPGVTTRGGGL